MKTAALLALQESSSPEALLMEIEGRLGQGRGIVAIAEGELDSHLTTSTAPQLVRLLATSSHVPNEARRLAQLLRGVKDEAYKLHVSSYENDTLLPASRAQSLNSIKLKHSYNTSRYNPRIIITVYLDK